MDPIPSRELEQDGAGYEMVSFILQVTVDSKTGENLKRKKKVMSAVTRFDIILQYKTSQCSSHWDMGFDTLFNSQEFLCLTLSKFEIFSNSIFFCLGNV